MRISGVYEIMNTITCDCYIGSSIDLDRRKRQHFCESFWKYEPNKPLYNDIKQYGKDNFLFIYIWLCNPEELKKYEQIAIDKYNPQYNKHAAYTGLSKEEYHKQYRKENADKIKQYSKENADKIKQYRNQQCLYKNELLSLNALRNRFYRQGLKHPVLEAKKYLIKTV